MRETGPWWVQPGACTLLRRPMAVPSIGGAREARRTAESLVTASQVAQPREAARNARNARWQQRSQRPAHRQALKPGSRTAAALPAAHLGQAVEQHLRQQLRVPAKVKCGCRQGMAFGARCLADKARCCADHINGHTLALAAPSR